MRAIVAALLLSAGTAVAQKRERANDWVEVRVNPSVEVFSRSMSPWHWHTLSFERHTEEISGSIAVYSTRRFGLTDMGASAEITRSLWSRAYGAVRVAGASAAQVVARSDVSAEVFQGLAGGWEVAPSFRRMRFKTGNVPIYGMAVAKYAGDWYLRARSSLTNVSGSSAASGAITARRYFGAPVNFVELGAGAGREVEVADAFGGTLNRGVQFASLRGQRLMGETWGLTVGVSANADEILPNRYGLSVALFSRR